MIPSWELTHPTYGRGTTFFPATFTGDTPWKINSWNLQPSPMKRKENDLNQTSNITARKINMEPENTPLEEEHHLWGCMFQPLIFSGVCWFQVSWWAQSEPSKNMTTLAGVFVFLTQGFCRMAHSSKLTCKWKIHEHLQYQSGIHLQKVHVPLPC